MLDAVTTKVVLHVRYSKLVPKFLELRRTELNTIQSAIDNKVFPALERIGQNLRGAGTSYGLEGLYLLGTRLEAAAIEEDEAASAACKQDLSHYLDAVQITYRNSVLFAGPETESCEHYEAIAGDGEFLCHFAATDADVLQSIDQFPIDVLVGYTSGCHGVPAVLTTVSNRHPEIVQVILINREHLDAVDAAPFFRCLNLPATHLSQLKSVLREAVAHAN